MRTLADDNNRALADLLDVYQNLEDKLPIENAPADRSLKNLVTFDDARVTPIHRWMPFKEGFSSDLISWLLEEGVLPRNRRLKLADPFAGVATTLLSSQLLPECNHVSLAAGVELNPTIRFAGQAKIAWPDYKPTLIRFLIERLSKESGRCGVQFPLPALTTLSVTRSSGKYAFNSEVLQDLLYYRHRIECTCKGTVEYLFFMLAWTAIIEKASFTRKDGRALRLLQASPRPDVKQMLLEQCESMLRDVEMFQHHHVPARVFMIAGDGRRLPFVSESFDALCYSPPYLNNIDYSEVYKLELWLRGDISNHKNFRALRFNTFRSHPSVRFPESKLCQENYAGTEIDALRSVLLRAVPYDRFRAMRQRLFSGYIDDMLRALAEQRRIARPGATIVCVVGNSLHGGQERIPICTDLLIGAAAQSMGLMVERLQVARQLPRRDNQNGWLRESIIIMQAPCRKSGA